MEIVRIPTRFTFAELAMKATTLIQLNQFYISIRDNLGTYKESLLRKLINVDLKNVKIEHLEMTPKVSLFQEFLNDYFNETKEFNELIIEAIKKENYVSLLWINSVQSSRLLLIGDEILNNASSSSKEIFEWALSIFPSKIEYELYNGIIENIVKNNLVKNLDLILKNVKFEEYKITEDVIRKAIEFDKIELFIWGIYKSSKQPLFTEILIECGYYNRTEHIKYISTYYIEEILEKFSENKEKLKEMIGYVYDNGSIEIIDIMNIYYKDKLIEMNKEEIDYD